MDKIVYHYCSVDTFIKIIKNSEIWLTDVTKSNDSKELSLAYDQLIDELDARIKKCDQNKGDMSPFEECKNLLLDHFDIDRLLYHVCCFSADSDSLSQWAMYADNATGVAIGFDSGYFENLNEKNSMLFGKVNYSLDSFTDVVNEKVRQMLDEYNSIKDQNDSWLVTFLNFVINDFMKMFCFYKHSCFMQENEYRLIYNSRIYSYSETTRTIEEKLDASINPVLLDFERKREVTAKGIDFYSSRGKIVSYKPLNMNNLNQAIKEIVIGPKSAVKVRDVDILLLANHVDVSKIKITRSNTTYQ